MATSKGHSVAWTAVTVAVVLANACSGPQQSPVEETPPLSADADVVESDAPPTLAQSPEQQDEASPLSARPFPDAPLRDEVNALVDAALATVRGETVGQLPLPTASRLDPNAPMIRYPRSDGSDPRPTGELTVLGWVMEMDLVLKVGTAQPSLPTETNDGLIRALLYLGPNGWRIAGLRAAMMPRDPGYPAPPGLADLDQLAQSVLQHLRDGSIVDIVMGDAERRIINDDRLWTMIREELPREDAYRRVSRLAANVPNAPITYRLDDLGVLVRDETGMIFAFIFELVENAGTIQLGTTPFITVRPMDD